MPSLKLAKKAYDLMKNDRVRAVSLLAAEKLGVRKDVVRMDTNDVCNIECIMCTNKLKKITNENIMTFDDYLIVIDKIALKTKFLYLSCSYEPLVTPNFEKYIEYTKKCRKGAIPFVSLCTNALLLNEKIIEALVINKIDEIIVSFNGFDQDDYNRIMYRSNYEIVTRNLKRLNDYKHKAGSDFPKIKLNSILMKSNIINFNKVLQFIEDYNIDTIQFRELVVSNNANNIQELNKEIITSIDENNLKKSIAEIRKAVVKLSESGRNVILPKSILIDGSLAEKKSVGQKSSCSIPYFSSWINYDGEIRACTIRTNESIVGNIVNDNIESLNKNRREFRRNAIIGACTKKCTINSDTTIIL